MKETGSGSFRKISQDGARDSEVDRGDRSDRVDTRAVVVRAPADAVFRAVCRVGGSNGWHGGHWLWRIRGWMDEIAGGPGLRRGRRDPERLSIGDPLDFWRVSAIDPDRRLELRAEMRMPGEAWLTFSIAPLTDAVEQPPLATGVAAATAGPRCRLTQTARFRPHGLAGQLYWLSVAPLHGIVFPGLLRGLARDAEGQAPGARLQASGRDAGRPA